MSESTEPTPDATTDAVEVSIDAQAEPSTDAQAAPSTEGSSAEAATAPDATAPAEPAPAVPAPTTAAPRPAPVPRPTPRPVPRPAAAPQQNAAASASSTTAPPVAAIPDEVAQTKAARAFGRVDDDGTVYVTDSAGERVVGQFPGVTPDEAMSLYVRRFLDLQAKIALFEARLGTAELASKEIDATLAKISDEVAEPAAVGDLDGLRARVDAIRGVAAAKRAELDADRAAAKEVALAARTAIVEAAERLAGTEPAKIQWKPAGEELRVLLEQWKTAQRSGPRLDRPSEEALWKRFSHARTTFDRERRHFFAELEKQNAGAKASKAALVAEAERLSTSTEWGATAGAYRDLMDQWKNAGRANRKDDDMLWSRFRRAQDAFFSARDTANAATDAEYGENLVVKEALLVEAEALLPVTDLAHAKAALRGIQERWEEAGKVPRGDVQRVEGRMRAVETAVRDAEQAKWTRSNPETRARAEGAAAQLEAAIAALEADLEAARSRDDARKVKEIETALAARRSWLEQVVKAAADSRG
ncbi:DUF349 domain-containing protein [Sanguibacter sp. 25GB23B1]|uniref:DUF349 domain-containing protein n=1 Tax=unclassified Sanguibacter TaxID=2645534 RepID=UPI0032AF688C